MTLHLTSGGHEPNPDWQLTPDELKWIRNWRIAQQTGWTLDYIETLSLQDHYRIGGMNKADAITRE